MNRRRQSAMPSIKAMTRVSIADAGVATTMGRKENAQRPTFNAQHRNQKSSGLDVIGHSEIDSAQESQNAVGKIDIAGLLTASPMPVRLAPRTGRYRRSQLNFCRACLLSKMLSPKLSPARS